MEAMSLKTDPRAINPESVNYYVDQGLSLPFVTETLNRASAGSVNVVDAELLLQRKIEEQRETQRFSHEDFESGTVFEYIIGISDEYERAKAEERLSKRAREVGFKNFAKLYRLYKKSRFGLEDYGIRKPALSLNSLENWLEENGIQIRHNMISHNNIPSGLRGDYNPETLNNELHIILHDALKREFSCNQNLVGSLLDVVGGKNRFNPVLDLLEAAPPWDGRDRLEDLFRVLHLPEDDTLSRLLVKKWLWQTRSLLENDFGVAGRDAFGADGVLVLQGPQGCGKTTFARMIAIKPDFVKLGRYVDARNRDTVSQVTSCWIAELGEIETTLRSDLERLKAFITSEADEYRLPYGRKSVHYARRTSFIATCNTEQFLVDPTGSRRFWTVPVSDVDLDALEDLDMVQLWKQVETWCRQDLQGFRLTPVERELLAERNAAHEKPLEAQTELEDILQEAKDGGYQWQYMTVTEFITDHPALKRYSAAKVSKALDKIGIAAEKRRIDGRPSRARRLPKYTGQPLGPG